MFGCRCGCEDLFVQRIFIELRVRWVKTSRGLGDGLAIDRNMLRVSLDCTRKVTGQPGDTGEETMMCALAQSNELKDFFEGNFKFISEIFEGKTPEQFDEETLQTINKFFENSLNVSETSRQLYIHRNTLVYRLDKLQKTTGLDLRVFEDAITFKIALMVVKYMSSKEEVFDGRKF